MKRNSTTRFMILLSVILSACAPGASTPAPGNNSPAVGFSGNKLNLNTVRGDELLATIPGFGSRMVREFQEYRPYISIREFRQQNGKYVDDAQVAEYEKYVYVPISYNDSDSETLQQIPGLDPAEADSIIYRRPYASADAFLARLGEFVSTDELETAKSYLGDHQ